MKVEIKKKTMEKINDLFKEKEFGKPIKTLKGILKKMDSMMRECLIDEKKSARKNNYSNAEINENFFFSLFYLREEILGKELNVHKERKRLLTQSRSKATQTSEKGKVKE